MEGMVSDKDSSSGGKDSSSDSKHSSSSGSKGSSSGDKGSSSNGKGSSSNGKHSSSNDKDSSSGGKGSSSSGSKEPKCVGSDCKKKKDGFTQQLNPASIDGTDHDEDDFDSHPTVDYASTLESAYDNLDKLLSSDAINSMSEDTQRLAEKQQMLMGNINKLQPMMDKASSLLEGLNMDKMTGMLGGLQDKLSGMGRQ